MNDRTGPIEPVVVIPIWMVINPVGCYQWWQGKTTNVDNHSLTEKKLQAILSGAWSEKLFKNHDLP